MSQARGLRVREAEVADLESITAIYAHHVRHGLASFEAVPPERAVMEGRYRAVLARGLPYLAAERDPGGAVSGFAYAGPYNERPGYRYTLEDSLYVAPEARGRGLGRALLTELLARCTALGYRQMLAVIGDSENQASIRLHEALGFRHAGSLAKVGFKFGRWIDCVIMQRALGEGAETLPARDPEGLP